jgi:hypothetical protein
VLEVTRGSDDPTLMETPWIEIERISETGELKVTCRPGKEGKVIRW